MIMVSITSIVFFIRLVVDTSIKYTFVAERTFIFFQGCQLGNCHIGLAQPIQHQLSESHKLIPELSLTQNVRLSLLEPLFSFVGVINNSSYKHEVTLFQCMYAHIHTNMLNVFIIFHILNSDLIWVRSIRCKFGCI